MHHPPQGPRIHRKNSIANVPYRRATKSSIPATYFSPSLTFDHLIRGSLGEVPNQYRIPLCVHPDSPSPSRACVRSPVRRWTAAISGRPVSQGARLMAAGLPPVSESYPWGLRTQTILLPAALGTAIIDLEVADLGRNIGSVCKKMKWCRRERSFDRRGSDRAGCSVRVSRAAPLHRVHLHNTSLVARFAREPVRTASNAGHGLLWVRDRLARKQSHKTVPETK